METDILVHLREVRERQAGAPTEAIAGEDYRITGVDATFEGDEHN